MEQLKDQMTPCVSGTMLKQLFHDDFKFHIKALEVLNKVRSFSYDLFGTLVFF